MFRTVAGADELFLHSVRRSIVEGGNEPRDEHSYPFEVAVSNAECISQDKAAAAGNGNSHAGDSRNMNRSPAILVGDHRPPLVHTCTLDQKGRKNHSVAKETIYLHSMRMQRGKLVFPISYAASPLLVSLSLSLFCHSFSNTTESIVFLSFDRVYTLAQAEFKQRETTD